MRGAATWRWLGLEPVTVEEREAGSRNVGEGWGSHTRLADVIRDGA
jgi:hypothetical protein